MLVFELSGTKGLEKDTFFSVREMKEVASRKFINDFREKNIFTT